MKLTFKKSRYEIRLVGIFILFVLFFTFFRTPIGSAAAWMLAMTREINVNADGEEVVDEFTYSAKKKKLDQRKRKANKKKKTFTVDKPGKPQRRKKPKTKTPIVLLAPEAPTMDDKVFALFPTFRKFTGDNWKKEKTEVRMSTDGDNLYLLARLYDQRPNEAITKHSKQQSSSAWQDDGIEVFLMKDRKSKIYCQYVLSVSGIGHTFYLKTTKVASRGSSAEKPKNFINPEFDAEEHDNYFDLKMTIDLANVGIFELVPDDTFLLQIVRNYRGQGTKRATTLQLFPTHIYADKRFGIINHDRRAFQKVKIIDKTVYSTMGKSGEQILKGMH